MSGFGTQQTCWPSRLMSAYRGIVLQKSPRRGCRIEIRNNRIEAIELLNQCCASAPDLESILRARMSKIVLQHNPSLSGPFLISSVLRYSLVGQELEHGSGERSGIATRCVVVEI